MVQYKLTYFNIRGLAEPIRQLFALANVPYEDERISRENKDWEARKSTTPFGQLPVLNVDGKEIAQSYAIARHLARQFGFAGKNAWEEAEIDAVADQFKDFFKEVTVFFRVMLGAVEGDKEKLKAEEFNPAVEKHFPLFEKILSENESGFYVGQYISWADVVIAELLSNFLSNIPECFAQYPHIAKHIEKVHTIPRIAKWRAERPLTNI